MVAYGIVLVMMALLLALLPRFRRASVVMGFVLLAVSLTAIRFWDFKFGSGALSLSEYALVWVLAVVFLLLALALCRIALETGNNSATAANVTEALGRIRGALALILLALLVPLVAGFTVWFLHTAAPHAVLGIDVATAVTCGLFLPLGFLVQLAFRYKVTPSSTRTNPARNESWRLVALAAVTYILGLGVEALGQKAYVRLTVSFVAFWLVVVSFEKFANTASALTDASPHFQLVDLGHDKARALLSVLSWIAFGYIYFQILSFVF